MHQKNINTNNKKLVDAWIKLDNILNAEDEHFFESQLPDNLNNNNVLPSNIYESTTPGPNTFNNTKSIGQFNQLRPQSSKNSMSKLRPLSGVGLPKSQHIRPISAISQISRNSSQPFFQQPYQNQIIIDQESMIQQQQQQQQQQLPVSRVTSLKSLMNLRAKSRPHNRPGTANTHVPQNDLQLLSQIPTHEVDILIQKSETIHSLNVDQVLDLFTAKCLDSKVEYNPEQAVKFMEKIKKQCKKRSFNLIEQGLSLESANVIGHVLQQNEYFCRIELEKNWIGDSGVALIGEALKYNTTIVHLNLASNDISSTGFVSLFESLLENESIISLDISSREGLSRNRIPSGKREKERKDQANLQMSSEDGADALEQFLRYNKTIMFLNLCSTSLSIESLENIVIGAKNNQSLIQLNLSHNDLGPLTTQLLNQHLQYTQILDLNLSMNNLGDGCIANLCDMLGHKCKMYRFKKLDLSENNINSNGISRLFQALTKNIFLENLNLDKNNFSNKSFSNIANLLYDNTSIIKLSMNFCQIQKDGGEQIGYGLARNKTLQELYLSNNKLRDHGVSIIADCLKENDVLRILDFQANKCSDQGGISIANVLNQPGNQIESINLKENNLHDYAGVLLAESLRANQRIIKLNVDRNPISYKYSEDIIKSVKQNINNIKKHQVPNFLDQMHSLKAQERLKYDIYDQEQKQKSWEETVQIELQEYQRFKNEEEKKEFAKTKKIEDELEIYNNQFNEINIKERDLIQFIEEEKFNYDQEIKKVEKQYDLCRYDIQRLEYEVNKNKTSQLTKKLQGKSDEQQAIYDLAFKKNKQQTQEYNSFYKSICLLRDKIQKYESGYDSDEEREKQELQKKLQEEQEQQQQNQLNLQNNKKKKKSSRLSGNTLGVPNGNSKRPSSRPSSRPSTSNKPRPSKIQNKN